LVDFCSQSEDRKLQDINYVVKTNDVQTFKLTLYKYKFSSRVVCEISACHCCRPSFQSNENAQISDIGDVLVQNHNQILIN